jgi:hypothetical protein
MIRGHITHFYFYSKRDIEMKTKHKELKKILYKYALYTYIFTKTDLHREEEIGFYCH